MKNLLLCACACLLLACAPQTVGPGGHLTSAVVKHQPDVPVPLNFTYLADRSRVEQFSTFRLCEMTYQSSPDPKHGIAAVLDFYKRLMPAYDWTVMEGPGGGDAIRFRKNGKDDEFCRIKVWREGKTTTLFILIGNDQLTKDA